MIAVSLLALGLPLAGVILFVSSARPRAVPAASSDPGLEKALQDLSEKTLAPKTLDSGNREAIRLVSENPSIVAQRVTRLAASVGGTAMPAPADNGTDRLWVSIPEKRVPAFSEACRGDLAELEFPPVDENQARILIEIIVEKRGP